VQENYLGNEENLGKFMEVENLIWNTFYYHNFFQTYIDFELFKRFWVKPGLTDLCSYRPIATHFANLPELYFRQGVLHSDLKHLYYHLTDMHIQYLKIEEDIEFPKVLTIKQLHEKT
jgi:hypothetical protein